MNKKSLVSGGAAAILLGTLAVGCQEETSSPAVTRSSGRVATEGMTGISLHNYRISDTRWILQADTASVFRDRKRVEAEWVVIDFFEEDEHVSTMTADRGILLQHTDDLEVRGHVRVVTDDGAVLKTTVLYWDHGRSRIHTDQFVEITRGENVLTGVGLEADPGLDRVDLKEEVRGTVRSNPEELLDDDAGGAS